VIDIDLVNQCIREVVRRACGMAAGSVRPANQKVPAGKQDAEYATVLVMNADTLGTPERTLEDTIQTTTETIPAVIDPDTEEVITPEQIIVTETPITVEHLDTSFMVVASVNFFGNGLVDSAGLQRHGAKAFGRAASLESLLWGEAIRELMNGFGLGFQGASQARNLTAIADANYESRGQVDLTFQAGARDTATVQTILSASIETTMQAGGQFHTITSEVTA
jgi:hypothetical protein